MRAADERHAEHDDVERDQQPVEAVLVLTQPRIVDPREHERDEHADTDIDRLALDVEQRLALHCGARRALQRDQRARDETEGAQHQQRVEAQHRPRPRDHNLLGGTGLNRSRAHSVFELPTMNCPRLPKNHCDRICRAAGAAAAAPKPPCSTVTTTRIGFTGSGT